MIPDNPAALVPYVTGGAFILAFVFGAVGNKTHFCTMGAVSDWVNMGELSRFRMWLLAIAVAMLGAAALEWVGLVDYSKSIYTTPNLTWLSHLVGGFLFGVGMTLGSGCDAACSRACSSLRSRVSMSRYRSFCRRSAVSA